MLFPHTSSIGPQNLKPRVKLTKKEIWLTHKEVKLIKRKYRLYRKYKDNKASSVRADSWQ